MRTVTTILFLFILHKLNATTYYVSNSAGSDGNNGLTPIGEWKTLNKVNGYSFQAGDSILLKCGDSWNETLRPPRSDIHFGTYGTGERPLITGFISASFGAPASSIYTAATSGAPDTLNVVKINGILKPVCRQPNTGYSTFSSYSGDSIINTSLTGTPDYTGKEIVVRNAPWETNISVVETQTTGQLKLNPKLRLPPIYHTNGYFFQNHLSFLDTANEWYYDGDDLKVYQSTTPTVEYSTLDTLVFMKEKSNVSFTNINFSGANYTCFELDSCTNISIQNCTIKESNIGVIGYKTTYTTISNDSFINILSFPIHLKTTASLTNPCSHLVFQNNYVSKVGLFVGVKGKGQYRYWHWPHGLQADGYANNISYNRFDSIGYTPIAFTGDTTHVTHNYITNYCFVNDDGGGIYTVNSFSGSVYYLTSTNTLIRKNIIGYGFVNPAGTDGSSDVGKTHGIYLDDRFNGPITVDSNTVFSVAGRDLNLRTARVINAYDNLFIDSVDYIINMTGNQSQTYSLDFKRNIYYQKNASQYISVNGDLSTYTYESDSNYILRPAAPSGLLRYAGVDYSLSGYQAATAYEDNSIGTLPSSTSSTTGRLIYNATATTSTEHVSRSYVDVYGNLYFGYFTLEPYSSVLLFPTTISFSKTFIIH